MKRFLVILLISAFTVSVLAQEISTNTGMDQNPYKKRKIHDVETNILFSYYEQDGDRSAVTGGQGTEELTDITPTIVVNLPVDSTKVISFDFGIDVITSASTDRINFQLSSASYRDARYHGVVAYQQSFLRNGISAGINASFSLESDYISMGTGFNFLKMSDDENRQLAVSGKFFFDRVGWGWHKYGYYGVTHVYPQELRDTNWYTEHRRHSYAISLSYSQVMTPRINAAVFADIVYQHGLLSTTFHRVYFRDYDYARVEKLPGTRVKFPVGIRLNYFFTNKSILRSYYRYYHDTWGIQAHTMEFESPVKITNLISVYPIYRYHVQMASKYFNPYKEHSIEQEYYTSDYDLSGFHSNEFGFGLSLSPAFGIFRYKIPFTSKKRMMKRLDLRYAHYIRSDGLRANIVSMAVSFGNY